MKTVFGYLLCVGIAVIMTIMIDGRGGVLITCILLLALAISLITVKYMSKHMSISIDCKHKLLAKGDIVEVKVRVGKHSHMPSPILELELEAAPQLSAVESSGLRFALAPNKHEQVMTVSFRADYSGRAYIKVKRFEVVDYLGIIRSGIVVRDSSIGLKIMPNVPDTGTQLEVIRTAANNIGFDDNEDETSETAIGSTGTPGYEHRTYSPGDPLKKINWKLSSKRGIYMVRLDEKLSVTSQVFMLDEPVREETGREVCRKNDIIIEGALAMLSMLSQQGLETDMYYYNGKWECMAIKALGDVYLLAESLADHHPDTPPQRLPDEAAKKGTALCFTTIESTDDSLASELFTAQGIVCVVGEQSGFNSSVGDIWTCSEQFEFDHLN